MNRIAKTNGTATVEDEKDDEDIEAGPELPPDEGHNQVDDEEGRFFGGGITKNTVEVLDFIDEQDKNENARTSLKARHVWSLADETDRSLKRSMFHGYES